MSDSLSPPAPLRILIVDDSPEDRAEFRRLLTCGQEQDWRVTEAGDAESAMQALKHALPDCLVLDIELAHMSGLPLLDTAIQRYGSNPCGLVTLTASSNTALAVELLKAGAHDFLQKTSLSAVQLRRAVRNAVENAATRREIRRSRHELEEKNTALVDAVDQLTREAGQ